LCLIFNKLRQLIFHNRLLNSILINLLLNLEHKWNYLIYFFFLFILLVFINSLRLFSPQQHNIISSIIKFRLEIGLSGMKLLHTFKLWLIIFIIFRTKNNDLILIRDWIISTIHIIISWRSIMVINFSWIIYVWIHAVFLGLMGFFRFLDLLFVISRYHVCF